MVVTPIGVLGPPGFSQTQGYDLKWVGVAAMSRDRLFAVSIVAIGILSAGLAIWAIFAI
jgi:hypothetical protein